MQAKLTSSLTSVFDQFLIDANGNFEFGPGNAKTAIQITGSASSVWSVSGSIDGSIWESISSGNNVNDPIVSLFTDKYNKLRVNLTNHTASDFYVNYNQIDAVSLTSSTILGGPVTGSGDFFVDGTVYGKVGDLILSSSATSQVFVSGNLAFQNYTLKYNSTGTALELLDASNAKILWVDDGTDDVNFSGSLNIATGEELRFDVGVNTVDFNASAAGTVVWQFANTALGGFGGATSTAATIYNDKTFRFGTVANYWQVYNSTGTAFELWSTNVDGGGTDGKVLWVTDGTDDVNFSGSVAIKEQNVATITTGSYPDYAIRPCSDGNGGSPCLAMNVAGVWYRIALGNPIDAAV